MVARVNHCIYQFEGAISSFEPVLRYGNTRPGGIRDFTNYFNFGICVGIEMIDTDNRVDSGFSNCLNMVDKIFCALFYPCHILLFVTFI